MASLTGSVVDGVYNKTQASTEATSNVKEAGNAYDKEMFLQLLVAEMQYQDPLEPTSNTEYVAELASFSQIEAIQSVQDQMQTIQANSLVGNHVIVLDDNNEYVSGKVDYVYNDSGELYLAINDGLYSIDKLDSVVDEQYYNAVLASDAFKNAVSLIPDVAAITLPDEDKIVMARTMYDAMDNYTKGFVSKESYEKLVAAEKRLESLKPVEEDAEVENDVEGEE